MPFVALGFIVILVSIDIAPHLYKEESFQRYAKTHNDLCRHYASVEDHKSSKQKD